MKKKILNFILSRFTDYDKIKQENEQLKLDNEKLNNNIKTLIEEPDSLESIMIIQTHRMKTNLSKMLWMGSFDIVTNFQGFYANPKEVKL